MQFNFTTPSGGGGGYFVLTSTDVALPYSQWTILGTATYLGGIHYTFSAPFSPNEPARFYVVFPP